MNFLLVCGILFSAASHITTMRNLGPSQDLVDSLTWLSMNSKNDSVILSSVSNGFPIEYFAGRKVIMDPLSMETVKAAELLNESSEIYKSETFEKTGKLLNKYGINYIIIDKKMTEGEIWNSPNEGLLFLAKNQKNLQTTYEKGGVKIIYYLT